VKVIVLGKPEQQTRLSRTEGGFALSRATDHDGILVHLTDEQASQFAQFVLECFTERELAGQ
jgi:hypothetical protein